MTHSLRAYSLTMAVLVLAGCSHHSSLPDFTASGYLADQGTIRIWRKNSDNRPIHMLTVYTSFDQKQTVTSEYSWQQGKLTSIFRQVEGQVPESVTLRFDTEGNLNFMQRQRGDQRQAVAQDAIALYQFDAKRMLEISDSLLAGRVVMTQGRWRSDGVVTTCGGQSVTPAFDGASQQLIWQAQARSNAPVSVSWLEAPQGTQLIYTTAKDLCASEPKEADF